MAAAGQAAFGWFLPCSCALLLKPRQNEAPVRCLKPGPGPPPKPLKLPKRRKPKTRRHPAARTAPPLHDTAQQHRPATPLRHARSCACFGNRSEFMRLKTPLAQFPLGPHAMNRGAKTSPLLLRTCPESGRKGRKCGSKWAARRKPQTVSVARQGFATPQSALRPCPCPHWPQPRAGFEQPFRRAPRRH